MKGTPVLSILLLVPLAASVVVLLLPASQAKLIKWFTVVATGIALAVSLAVLGAFSVGSSGMQMLETVPWVPAVGMAYKVGIDGLSLPLEGTTQPLTYRSFTCKYEPYQTRVFVLGKIPAAP